MKKLIYLSALCSSILLSAQQNAQINQSRIEGTDRPQPAPLAQDATSSNNETVESSDTGAQRPVLLSKSGISGFFGYDSKYFYRSNPFALEGKLKQQKTGMWTNTFFGGASLSSMELDSSIVTPYIGGSWTTNDYLEDNLDRFNFNTASAYGLLLAQHESGWSGRVGISYFSDRLTETDTEDYSEYFPNIGISKAYNLSADVIGYFDAYFGLHESTVGTYGENFQDNLDNMEITGSYSLFYKYGNIKITPKYTLSFRSFDKYYDISKGSTVDRDDLLHNISLKAELPISGSVKVGLFGGYTSRDSSGTVTSNDYENLDAGLGLTLKATF